MDGHPKIQREPLSDGSLHIKAAPKSHCQTNSNVQDFVQGVIVDAHLVVAANHVLALGQRASIEFLKDIARGSDFMAKCADFSRIPASTYRALTAMSAHGEGGKA